MSKLRIIKYFRGPAFLGADWQSRNPYLKSGEVGYELSGGKVIACKVGPGLWNDLDYMGGDIYNYVDVPTNPLGDATGSLQGLTTAEILYKILNPYQVPVFSQIKNNANGIYTNEVIREIGQQLNGPVSVIYNLANSANLSGATPINITAGGVFSNEGNVANSGNISLSLAAPLLPLIPTVITIVLKATHLQGQTGGSLDTTTITYKPKIMWVQSAVATIPDGATFMGLANRSTILSSDFKLTYDFNNTGYCWIAVPTMLNPTGLLFADVYNPILPLPIDMQSMGTISINNGVGTYNYDLYRSSFSLLNPVKIKIATTA